MGEEPTAGKPGPLKVVQYSLLLNVVMFYTSRKRGEGRRATIVVLTQRPTPDFLRLQVVGLEPDVLEVVVVAGVELLPLQDGVQLLVVGGVEGDGGTGAQ